MMKSMICLSLVLLPLITVVEGGWWSPIPEPPSKFPVNALDPNVVEIANFAVKEHNKQSQASLVYEKVVRGTSDWTMLRRGGMKYSLIISAKNEVDGVSKTYEAIVIRWYSGFTDYNQLKSFKAVV